MSGTLEATGQEVIFGGLVLSRAVNESITIGDDIEVMVIQILGGKARLLVKAPKRLTVNRREVTLRSDFRTVKRGGDEAGNLVVSRYQGEAIVIGGEVTVTVDRVSGNKVRLRTQAPMAMKVMRKELVRF